jgi:hypothetical protein
MLIQRYYDGELDPVEMAEYENHRRRCSECKELDERYASVFEALDTIPVYEPSEEFSSAVLARVNIARYRVGPARRALRALGAGWEAVPTPVRVTSAIAAVFALFVTGYRPFLDFFISLGERTVTFLGSGVILLRELGRRSETLIEYFTSATNYRVAAEVLLRTASRVVSNVPIGVVILVAVAFVALMLFLVKTARIAWKKGETDVRII